MNKFNRKRLLTFLFSILSLAYLYVEGSEIIPGSKERQSTGDLRIETFKDSTTKEDQRLKVSLLEIIDGDTFKISFDGKTEHLRLIGVDCPEALPNRKAALDSERLRISLNTLTQAGQQAKKFSSSLLQPGDEYLVEFDKERRDRFNRLLGYLYLRDGSMLNEQLISSGFARVMHVRPNTRYAERLREIALAAKREKIGLWNLDRSPLN